MQEPKKRSWPDEALKAIERASDPGTRELWLASYMLTELPPELFQLTHLRVLSLANNPLTSLPAELFSLSNLRHLELSYTQLTQLPPEVGSLRNLEILDLSRSRLHSLPPAIGNLRALRALDISRNDLRTLPSELGALRDTILLKLDDNPLEEPLPTVIGRGTPELFAYLRSLRSGEPQYEAKVLLVGEGNVGKTSLVAALRNQPFVEGRETTHGIELEEMVFPHPEKPVDIHLNTWDFGGQEVYRITHQFFFSRRALYILVWRPREGQEENAIEPWIRRIALRVGPDARILIVATHGAERNAELDFYHLKQRFGDMLVGHRVVDNATGAGIDDLRVVIAQEAARLPQMGELISSQWTAARQEILRRDQPRIGFEEFRELCKQHELDDEETLAFANLLHDLGHIIYYSEDEGLRDIVVLQPEWLTRAIGYVLEDATTREAKGELMHVRLRDILQRGGMDEYPTEYHPYFLRLMEKFDVSFRIPERDASLIGQLVPYERPVLPWDTAQPLVAGNRKLSLVCTMRDVPPGLMAWLTVRNHRFSAGLHWRRGVFLEHAEYRSGALFELVDDRQLTLSVIAPSPDYFFSILRDSLDDLIRRRWEGLSFDLLVPCRQQVEGVECAGLFKFKHLLRYREQEELSIDCHECMAKQDVALLLTGFAVPERPLQNMLEAVSDKLDLVSVDVQRAAAHAAESANQIRIVLRAISAEIDDCPRLFTLTRAGGRFPTRIWSHSFRLALWCEHPGQEHEWDDAVYQFSGSKELFTRLAPFMSLVVKTLQVVIPIAGAAVSVALDERGTDLANKIGLMEKIVQAVPGQRQDREAIVEPDREGKLTHAEGAGLRALRDILVELDSSFGSLTRVLTVSGDYLWVCPRHYREHDPGLPTLPA